MMVFLHVPKTAGSTFDFILQNSFGVRACDTDHSKRKLFRQRDLEIAQRLFPGLRSVSGHNLMDPLALTPPDPFFMTFLREPVARVISRYQDSVLHGGNGQKFDEWIRSDRTADNRQVRFMGGEGNLARAKLFLEKCSFVGLTEKFDLSLRVLERLSPYKLDLRYKRRRTARCKRIQQEIQGDQRRLALIREKNLLDIELYSFAVNEIFPKICARAGINPVDSVPSYEAFKTELQPKFLAFSAYNMLFYRQMCKVIYRQESRELDKTPLKAESCQRAESNL